MRKKAVSLLLVLCLLIGMHPVTPTDYFGRATLHYENKKLTSGMVGNVNWRFDEATGVLTVSPVSGTDGSMPDFDTGNRPPWYDLVGDIKQIVMKAGVSNVGNFAFCDVAATSVTLPEGIKKIGVEAFAACKQLTEIALPKSLTEIGDDVF